MLPFEKLIIQEYRAVMLCFFPWTCIKIQNSRFET